jgi:hypothetical protein
MVIIVGGNKKWSRCYGLDVRGYNGYGLRVMEYNIMKIKG